MRRIEQRKSVIVGSEQQKVQALESKRRREAVGHKRHKSVNWINVTALNEVNLRSVEKKRKNYFGEFVKKESPKEVHLPKLAPGSKQKKKNQPNSLNSLADKAKHPSPSHNLAQNNIFLELQKSLGLPGTELVATRNSSLRSIPSGQESNNEVEKEKNNLLAEIAKNFGLFANFGIETKGKDLKNLVIQLMKQKDQSKKTKSPPKTFFFKKGSKLPPLKQAKNTLGQPGFEMYTSKLRFSVD